MNKQESLGGIIPIPIVNKILRFVNELHAVDAQERTVIFRSVFGDIWKEIMRDIRESTPQYKVMISHDIINVQSLADINDVIPVVISSSLNRISVPITDILILNISSPDCNPINTFVRPSIRFPGKSHIQFHRKIGIRDGQIKQ